MFTAAYNSLKTWLAPAVPLLMVRFCGTTPNSTSLGKIMDEGIIKKPSPKCRLYWCLIEFIDWRYSQSCWYFRPLLWTALPIWLQICHIFRIRTEVQLSANLLLSSSVTDPDPGSGAFLTPKSGIWHPGYVKNPDPGLTSRIIFQRAWKQIFGLKILKFCHVDPDLGSGIFFTLNPWSGIWDGKILIRDLA